MIKINDLKLDTRQFNNAVATNVAFWYEYTDGEKNDKPSGIKLEVVLPLLNFEKANVKIPGDFKELPEFKQMQKIKFDNLNVSVYQNYKTKVIGLNAHASSYTEVN